MMKSSQAIVYIEIPLKVDFIHCPAEPMSLEYPGCPEHIEIEGIYFDGQPWQCSDERWLELQDKITQACWEEVKDR